MIDPILLTARLLAAQDAYHRLQTGSLRETIDHNGTRIQYSRADAAKLKGYIDDLEADLAAGQNRTQRRRCIVNYF